jgi:hypothetical protein
MTAEFLRENRYRYRVHTPYGSTLFDTVLDAVVYAAEEALSGKAVTIEAITAIIDFTEFTD